MKLKTGASAAILTLVLGAATAVAQAPPPSPQKPSPPAATEAPKTPVEGQILVQDANTVLAKELLGQTVYAPDKARIGTIGDLILSKDAKAVEGFVIGVGGFLGIGEKNVALKMDRLRMGQDERGGLQLTMDIKKEELSNAPSFKSKKDQDAERQAAERARSQPQSPAPGGGPKR